jgi:uncharacterized protein YceK
MKHALLSLLALTAISLGGCATVPLATGIAIAGVGISATALGVTAYNNCRNQGGCKAIPLPK